MTVLGRFPANSFVLWNLDSPRHPSDGDPPLDDELHRLGIIAVSSHERFVIVWDYNGEVQSEDWANLDGAQPLEQELDDIRPATAEELEGSPRLSAARDRLLTVVDAHR